MEKQMTPTHAKILRRRTHGAYEHEEIEVHFELSQEKTLESQLLVIRKQIENSLYTDLKEVEATPSKLSDKEVAQTIKEVKEKKEPAKKTATKDTPATKTAKDKVEDKNEEGQDIPPVIPEEAKEEKPKKAVKAVKYNSTIPTHKAKLSAFLNENFPTWKQAPKGVDQAKYVEGIKKTTASFNGLDFEDSNGEILPSFHSFVEKSLAELQA